MINKDVQKELNICSVIITDSYSEKFVNNVNTMDNNSLSKPECCYKLKGYKGLGYEPKDVLSLIHRDQKRICEVKMIICVGLFSEIVKVHRLYSVQDVHKAEVNTNKGKRQATYVVHNHTTRISMHLIYNFITVYYRNMT